MKQILF
jgi:hypothetical protein